MEYKKVFENYKTFTWITFERKFIKFAKYEIPRWIRVTWVKNNNTLCESLAINMTARSINIKVKIFVEVLLAFHRVQVKTIGLILVFVWIPRINYLKRAEKYQSNFSQFPTNYKII